MSASFVNVWVEVVDGRKEKRQTGNRFHQLSAAEAHARKKILAGHCTYIEYVPSPERSS